jgi:hypothetical protein
VLLAARPSFGELYSKARCRRPPQAGEPERDALIRWVAGYEAPELKTSLRKELLPEICNEVDVPLAEALLQNLPSDEVATSLSVLTKSTNGFAPPKVLATLQEVVAGPFPKAVREWALTNNRWSAGIVSLVAATFTPDQTGFGQVVEFGVRAVCDSNWTPAEVSDLFGWLDWDKAKELRKELIRSFTGSNWSPGDLALAAWGDEQLLRKLMKRTLRLDHGEGYVVSILHDLASRSNPEAAHTAAIVRNLASNPDCS